MKIGFRIAIIIFVFVNVTSAQEFRSYNQGDLSYADFQGKVLDVDDSSGEKKRCLEEVSHNCTTKIVPIVLDCDEGALFYIV